MVDTPGNNTTTRTITVGQTVSDILETVGDHDWFRVELTAGQSITIFLDGLSLVDPYLYIRDANGNLLYENDDINAGLVRDSRISFTASQSGTYYIDVAAWQPPPDSPDYPGYTGTYELSVSVYTPPPLATVEQVADQLVSGYWGGDDHHFNVTQGGSLTVNITGLTSAGQQLARAALATWTDIIGVNFVEVSAPGAQITFIDHEEGAHSDGTWSNGIITSAAVNVSTQWLADYGTGLNSYSFQTYIHEIGHALGLGHAGNYNGDASYPYDALFQNDGWPLSIMSYFSQADNSFFASQGFTETFILTPMLSDIVAMSTLYGLSTTTRTGNTTYGFNSNAGRDQFNASIHQDVAYTIFDSGGIDTLDYSGFTQNQRINLNPETFSNVGGLIGNVSIGRGVVIENAIGGSGNDTFIGNAANNVLSGGGGEDTLSYETATAAVRVDLTITTQQDTNGAGLDTLSGFERLTGSAFNDTLTGSSASIEIHGGDGNDRITSTGLGEHGLYGDNGDDWFVPGQGDDWINGGDGFDTVDYSGAIGPINAATEVAHNNTGNSGFDTIGSVEKIIGSNFNDTLWAFQVGHQVWGGSGNDTLKGSGFGTSQLNGGAGNDTYEVWHQANQVIEAAGEGTDLVVARANFTLGANLENLTLYQPPVVSDPYAGAAIADQTPGNFYGIGNDLANVIIGNGGANLLSGNAGNDTLSGNSGIDTLTGGAGNDAFQDTAANLNGDTIADFAAGDKIVISNASLAGFSFSLSGNTLTYTGGTLTLTGFAGQLQASAAAGGGVQLSVVVNDPRNDFNGDGRSDILWRNEDGLITDWLANSNGSFVHNWANFGAGIPTDWQVASTGDFNGDGSDDLLWRHQDGTLTNWLSTPSGSFTHNWSNFAIGIPLDWQVAGTGDFNGDGRDDILWRHQDGTLTDWLGAENGGFAANAANAWSGVPTDWQIAGIGDFNGDGRADILWRHQDGTLTNWLGAENGGFAANAANVWTGVPADWQVAGTGDFNGDGRDDILWRHEDGTLTDWLGTQSGGFTANGANAWSGVPTDWQVAGIGDFNGDGRDDILWRNTSGTISDWLGTPSGGFADNYAIAGTHVPIEWQIQPADILWM